MGIWLSCGHREDDFDKQYEVTTKEWEITEDGWTKALAYKVVCETCKKEYEEDGIVFNTDEEAINWLHNEEE